MCRSVEEHRTYVEYFQKEDFEVGSISVENDFSAAGAVDRIHSDEINLWQPNRFGTAVLRPQAKLLFEFSVQGNVIPGSYRYENANGQRFLVYCFDAIEIV